MDDKGARYFHALPKALVAHCVSDQEQRLRATLSLLRGAELHINLPVYLMMGVMTTDFQIIHAMEGSTSARLEGVLTAVYDRVFSFKTKGGIELIFDISKIEMISVGTATNIMTIRG